MLCVASSHSRSAPSRGKDSSRDQRPSRRYTPPSKDPVRTRARWHKPVGWLLLTVGLIVAALNGLMYMDDELTLLPGGFSLVYVVAGLPVAAVGGWFLGVLDEGQTVYR